MFFNFRSQQDLDESLELPELLVSGEKVRDVEYSSERSIERYFTRDKVRQMLKLITDEPAEDAGQDRGHSIPFYSDMIFGFNKTAINAKFFSSESQDGPAKTDTSNDKQTSPQQMIDVFMTPQSEDEFSEDSMSPEDAFQSPQGQQDAAKTTTDSPPVNKFWENAKENEPESMKVQIATKAPATNEVTELSKQEERALLAQAKTATEQAEETKTEGVDEEIKDSSEAEQKIEDSGPQVADSKHNAEEEEHKEKEVAEKKTKSEVEVFSDTQAVEEGDKTQVEEGQDASRSSAEKMERYLEESKDVDQMRLSYDDDEDGETICELADVQLEKPEESKDSKLKLGESSSSVNIDLQDVEQDQTSVAKASLDKYTLFEEYLSFINVEKDSEGAPKMLNSVLLGYWCNLFKSLVQTHAQEVFIYVYEHQELLERMLDHLYSPQMSEIFVRLLNFNKNVLTRKETTPPNSDLQETTDHPSSADQTSFSEIAAQEIRQSTIFFIIERIGTGQSLDAQNSALMCLMDLPANAQVLSVMTRPSSLEQIKQFLQIDDEQVKTNCFKLLHHLLCRTFEKTESGTFASFSSSQLSPLKESQKSEEHELQEAKNSAKEDLFAFMSDIVQVVIPFEMSLIGGSSSSDSELTIESIIGQIGNSSGLPRLGMMRLSALELLDKLQASYGLRMLEVFKEADLYNSLLRFYAMFPYNDIALRYVTNIIVNSLDHKLAKEMTAPPKRPSRILDLEPADSQEAQQIEEVIENEQSRRDALLVAVLFQTSLTETMIQLCQQRDKLQFKGGRKTTEMGYVAHLTRLGQLLLKICDKNDLVRDELAEDASWTSFVKECLQPRIDLRTGSLCKGKQYEKQSQSRFLSMFDDDNDDGDEQIDVFNQENNEGEGYDQRTNQAEMDSLMKPILDYDDNDEDENGMLKPKLGSKGGEDQDEEETGQYSLEKYFSNGDVDRGHTVQQVFSKRNGRQGIARRYSSDEDDPEGGSAMERRGPGSDSDDDELARENDPLSLEELDGWMNQINNRKNSQEEIVNGEDAEEISPGQMEESDYLKNELAMQDQGENPFEKQPSQKEEHVEEDEDEDDDGLALDFIAQVQKDRTSLRAYQNITEEALQTKDQADPGQDFQEFASNNYWRRDIEQDFSIDELLADYD